MGTITLQQAAQWCGGQVDPKYKDVAFLGANNDTRVLKPGQLFVALQGARDGHDFIPAALEKGAAAVLCTHCDGDYPAIVVSDTRLALGDIARGERQRIGMKVVGVTGSVGKSTTKEMVACVLEGTYKVAKTPVNHNNDIGMPMAILSMPEDTQIAVLEMGMNHFREIAYLSGIARPDLAVIINIGTMHIEHLGSMEGILQAKLEIREGMQSGAKLLLNGDDMLLWNLHTDTNINSVYFGTRNPQCDVRGENVRATAEMISMQICHAAGKLDVQLHLEGEHYVSDALAAISVGLELGVPAEKISSQLSRFRNMQGRQEVLQSNGYTIIRDCYNAGPESMAAALNVLGNRSGRRIAVLGDMLELGACATAEHYKVGRIAAEKCDILLTFGPNATRVLHGALTGGMQENCIKAFSEREQMADYLKQIAKKDDVILFKGSHGMHMELVLERFLQQNEKTEENQ
jgi:UDP-N-acetylmuramoyl-tripeptide--D-alanyl-D-alanine ligase